MSCSSAWRFPRSRSRAGSDTTSGRDSSCESSSYRASISSSRSLITMTRPLWPREWAVDRFEACGARSGLRLWPLLEQAEGGDRDLLGRAPPHERLGVGYPERMPGVDRTCGPGRVPVGVVQPLLDLFNDPPREPGILEVPFLGEVAGQ